MFLTGNYVAST